MTLGDAGTTATMFTTLTNGGLFKIEMVDGGSGNTNAPTVKIEPPLGSESLANLGWQVLWTPELVQRHRLYQFGLGRLMSFDEARLRSFFDTFLDFREKIGRGSWLIHCHFHVYYLLC